MKPILLAPATYNLIPASQRRTNQQGQKEAKVNGDWRPVLFTKPAPVARR